MSILKSTYILDFRSLLWYGIKALLQEQLGITASEMGSSEPVWEVVMKLKVTGLLTCLAGAVIVSAFPLPGNLIGIPIFAIGGILFAIRTGNQNWRNLR